MENKTNHTSLWCLKTRPLQFTSVDWKIGDLMECSPSKPQTFCFAFRLLPNLTNVCHKMEVSYFWKHTSGLGVFHFLKEKSSTLDGNYPTVHIYIYIYKPQVCFWKRKNDGKNGLVLITVVAVSPQLQARQQTAEWTGRNAQQRLCERKTDAE